MSVDRIIVPELPLRARLGVTEAERAVEQDVLVDLEMTIDLRDAGRTDALEHTADYDQACEIVADIVRARPYRLVEAMAERSATALLDAFARVTEVRVRIRKPGALRARGVPYAIVEVVRRRG